MILLAIMLAVAVGASAQSEHPPFSITVTGRQVWTVKYGIGDPKALAQENIAPGQLRLDQSLQADIIGKALDSITLEAHFDNKLGPGFQSFVLRLDQHPWHGEFGDFSVGEAELGVYNKQLLGLRLRYVGDGYTLSGLAARLEGISESYTFRGQVGHTEVLFSYENQDRPWEPAPYRRHIEGCYFFQLRALFVEGFTEVKLAFIPSQSLWNFLSRYGLDYLQEVIADAQPTSLLEGDFLVLRDQGDVLILRREPAELLRGRIQEAIDEYNKLADDKEKQYPFIEGSELERAFLTGLFAHALIRVDGDDYPFSSASRRRYLLLGEQDVIEESLAVFLRLPGEEEFRPSTDPKVSQFAWTLYPKEGVLQISFPDTFFQEGAALRVEFDYRRVGNVFMLGLSVVPGSERVYLNGRLLARWTDYTIDYEVGVLVLFLPLSSEDELRVDFERLRGGLGGYTEYEQALFGLTISIPGLDGMEISLFRALDFGRLGPTARTMPNTHTVGGVRLQGNLSDWRYTFTVGGAENIFPPGDNARIPAPNRINAIVQAKAPDGTYVIFAHQGGLTVYHAGTFASYGPATGLAGSSVRDLLPIGDRLLCATNAGFTVVRLWDEAPFDRIGNWINFYDRDLRDENNEPLGKESFALAFGDGTIYLATNKKVAAFAPGDMENPKKWRSWDLPAGLTPTVLLAHGRLYLGTEEGLFVLVGEDWEKLLGVVGPVHDLLAKGDELYIATGMGIRILRDGMGSGWIAYGEEVYALAEWDGSVWYATPNGLFRVGEPDPYLTGAITALGVGEKTLWAGGAADSNFCLDIWRLGTKLERFPQDETKIDGRDETYFRDIPAAEHTIRGIIGSLNLSKDIGDWRFTIDIGTRWPGYQAIGSLGTSDAHGVGFSASYTGEDFDAKIGGQWNIVDLSTHPQGRIAGSLDLAWSLKLEENLKPKLILSLSPVLFGQGMAEFSSLEMDYRLGVTWPGDMVQGQLGISGGILGPDWYIAGRMDGSLTFRLPPWTFELRGWKPLRSRGYPGDEELTLTARWIDGIDLVSWTFTWDETLRHRRLKGDWWRETRAGASLRFSAFDFAGGRVTPRANVQWRNSPTDTRWEIQGTATLELGMANFGLGAIFSQGFRPATERRDRSIDLRFSWEYRGWQGIRPSGRLQHSWQFLYHPGYGERLTTDQEASLKIAWEGAAPWRNELSLVYKGRDASLSSSLRFTWPTEFGSLGAEAAATWKEGRLEGKMNGTIGKLLAQGWDLAATVGYVFGIEPGELSRHGLYGELSLIATF